MQEVSQKWLDNQERRTTYKSFVRITLYDRNGEEIETFENADIISFTMEQEADYLNDNLPKYEINFTLDNHTGRFDVDYPPADDNLYSKLNARNKVVVAIGYQVSEDETDIEWIKGGTYYLSEWKISNNSLTADFTAREWLYFLTNTCDDNFISTYSITSAVQTLLKDGNSIKGFSDLTYNDYVVLDSSLSDYTTQGNANGNAINSTIQQLATAGCCTLYFDRENRLHIENKSIDKSGADETYLITSENSFEYPDITFDELLKEVYIDWCWYEMSPSDLSTIQNGNTYLVVEPTHYSPIGSPSSAGGDMWTWLNAVSVSATGKGTIPRVSLNDAQKYLVKSNAFILDNVEYTYYLLRGFNVDGDKATFVFSCDSPTKTFPATAEVSLYLPYYAEYNSSTNLNISTDTDGIVEQVMNDFVNDSDMALNIVGRTANYKNNRRIIECRFRADPRLDALDIIPIYKKYGDYEYAMVERIKYTWSGGMFNGELRARNIENPLEITYEIVCNNLKDGDSYSYGTEITLDIDLYTYIGGVLYSVEELTTSNGSVDSNNENAVKRSTSGGSYILTFLRGTTDIEIRWYKHGGARSVASLIISNVSGVIHTFADASWDEINAICKDGKATTYYSLGDSKTINGRTAYIVAFDHYYLSSNTSKTASICIGMNVSSSTEHYWFNNTNEDVYWNSCYLRTNSSHSYDMTSIYNTFDSDLQSIIQEVNTYYADSTNSSSGIQTISDTLFVPSVEEIYGDTNINNSNVGNLKEYANTYVGEGYQLEAFEELNLSSTSDTNISKYITNANTLFRTRYLNYYNSFHYWSYTTASNVCSTIEINNGGFSLFVLFNVGVKS